jgi:hypothetical protein
VTAKDAKEEIRGQGNSSFSLFSYLGCLAVHFPASSRELRIGHGAEAPLPHDVVLAAVVDSLIVGLLLMLCANAHSPSPLPPGGARRALTAGAFLFRVSSPTQKSGNLARRFPDLHPRGGARPGFQPAADNSRETYESFGPRHCTSLLHQRRHIPASMWPHNRRVS